MPILPAELQRGIDYRLKVEALEGAIMSASITHETAKTEYIEAGGVRYAYRRFGKPSCTPLVFCHRFRGTMDDWDPAVTNGFARERCATGFRHWLPGVTLS